MRQTPFWKLLLAVSVWMLGMMIMQPLVGANGADGHKIVRVGWYDAPGLQEGTNADSLSGFNYEYLLRIAQYTDWKYEFVFGDFGMLEKELIAGNIDIMGDVAKTNERMALYRYCSYPSCYSHTLLLCKPNDTRYFYDDYERFNGMIVGNSGSSFRQMMLDQESAKHHFQVVYRDYPSDTEMLAALDNGEVDTALISDAIQHKRYKIVHEWDPAAQYFVVTKERVDILDELNAAMGSIQASDRAIQAHLFDKYFGGNNSEFTIALTREERDFVKSAPPLVVLLAENQKPLSYRDNGQPKGFIPDYFALLSEKTGLTFTYVWCRNYNDMLQRFKAGEGDICGQIYENYGQDNINSFKILHPYVDLSFGFIYEPGVAATIRSVAVEEGNTVIMERLKAWGYIPVAFATPKACLDAVNEKRVDAAAMASNIFEQFAYHAAYTHLVYKSQSDLNIGLSLGVTNKDKSYLFRVLAKTMGTIPPRTVTQLLLDDSSLPPQYTIADYVHRNIAFIYIIIVLLVIILFLFLWYQRQKRFNLDMVRATEAQNSFFNNLSHDLRTPLTGILGYGELAMEAATEEKKNDYINKINKSGHILLALINDTLSLAKIERRHFRLSPSWVNTQEFLNTIIVPIQSQTQQKNQQFRCSFSVPQDECMHVDTLKFQDMLLNILSNAVKYTPAGGSIDFQVAHANTSELSRKQQYRIVIKDTGIGMSEDFLTHLFEPFVQERDARTAAIPGTGLGMSIVKRIVDLMDGIIDIQSAKDQGTTVTVTIPMDIRFTVSTSVLGNKSTQDVDSLRGMRVLLCEDNELNREIFTEIVSTKGVIVDTAEDGAKGVQAFAQLPIGTYQAILMDIRMPVMDGYEATRHIRAMDRADAKTIPIIALSANAYEEDIKNSLAQGMTEHLAKPIDNEKLFATLGKYVIKEQTIY